MPKQEKDYRTAKVIATLKINDEGQDFTELDVLENGVILGNNPIFARGRLSLLGIGTLDGKKYFQFPKIKYNASLKGLYIYIYDTGTLKPMPWNATTLNYWVIGTKKVVSADRFTKTK